MKIKDNFIASPVGDSVMLVDILAPSRKQGLYKLNDTAAFIMQQIKDEDLEKEQVLERILDAYVIDRATAEKDLDMVIETFRKLGAIE